MMMLQLHDDDRIMTRMMQWLLLLRRSYLVSSSHPTLPSEVGMIFSLGLGVWKMRDLCAAFLIWWSDLFIQHGSGVIGIKYYILCAHGTVPITYHHLAMKFFTNAFLLLAASSSSANTGKFYMLYCVADDRSCHPIIIVPTPIASMSLHSNGKVHLCGFRVYR